MKKKGSIFSQRESREVYCVLKVSVWRPFLARPQKAEKNTYFLFMLLWLTY